MAEKSCDIREVFEGLTNMLIKLKEPMKELIDYVKAETSGEKIGAEVAAFYKNLVDKGVPEDLAREMTKEYLEKRLELFKKVIEGVGKVNIPSGKGGAPGIIIEKDVRKEKGGKEE